MRRVLFITLLLALLLTTFGSASAQVSDAAVLGEVWWFWGGGYTPVYDPKEDVWMQQRVDMYLYRPDTTDGVWPFVGDIVLGTYMMPYFESPLRRQTWPAWQYADWDGFYYAEFMLPRDEAWFPCSYPYKWNCNYLFQANPTAPIEIEYHSPYWQADFELGLAWPYYDLATYILTDDFEAAWLTANPMDTTHPIVAYMVGETGLTYAFPFEILGYFWKWTDLEESFYWIPVP